MNPESAALLRLRKEIESELADLERLRREHEGVPLRGTSAVEGYLLRARASILHDLYSGIERVFVRIASELNGGVPGGEQWPRELLRDMTLDLETVRPAVITTRLQAELLPFLGFRHLFRNVYGYVIDSERLDRLDARFDEALDHFASEIRVFLD